jgi:hypothetical protein
MKLGDGRVGRLTGVIDDELSGEAGGWELSVLSWLLLIPYPVVVVPHIKVRSCFVSLKLIGSAGKITSARIFHFDMRRVKNSNREQIAQKNAEIHF